MFGISNIQYIKAFLWDRREILSSTFPNFSARFTPPTCEMRCAPRFSASESKMSSSKSRKPLYLRMRVVCVPYACRTQRTHDECSCCFVVFLKSERCAKRMNLQQIHDIIIYRKYMEILYTSTRHLKTDSRPFCLEMFRIV